MAKTPTTPGDTSSDESPYTSDGTDGKPTGPEHDASFSAPDFYDPKTGKRIETDWDSEVQRNDPGYDAKVMAGTVEKPAETAPAAAPPKEG